jgi:hypothetical protein
MSEDLVKADSSLLITENLYPEEIQRFMNAAHKLVMQGEHFHNRTNPNSKMILFIGTDGSNLVDMQVQGGDKLRQLIVCAIDMQSAQAMELYINWQDLERTEHPHLPEKVTKFVKGNIPPEIIDKINKSPVHTAKISLTTPADNEDLIKFSNILEGTSINRVLLEKLISHEKKMGSYVHEGESDKSKIPSKIVRLLRRKN